MRSSQKVFYDTYIFEFSKNGNEIYLCKPDRWCSILLLLAVGKIIQNLDNIHLFHSFTTYYGNITVCAPKYVCMYMESAFVLVHYGMHYGNESIWCISETFFPEKWIKAQRMHLCSMHGSHHEIQIYTWEAGYVFIRAVLVCLLYTYPFLHFIQYECTREPIPPRPLSAKVKDTLFFSWFCIKEGKMLFHYG